MNYYDILNINRNANQKEIKRAYKYHLEHNPNKFVINEAYQVLSHPFTKQIYDDSLFIHNTLQNPHNIIELLDTFMNNIEIQIVELPSRFTKSIPSQYSSSPIIEEIIDNDISSSNTVINESHESMAPLQIENTKLNQNKWVINENGTSKVAILNDADLENIIKSTLTNIKYVNKW